MYGICLLPVIPMRGSTSHKSEMINQVLFGESFELIEEEKEWVLIKLFHDSYTGWISKNQYTPVSKKIRNLDYSNKKSCTINVNNIKQPLILGSIIPRDKSLSQKLNIEYSLSFCDTSDFNNWFLKICKKYLNTPYMWGGRTPLGIDCSGYTQMVYRFFKIDLPRDSFDQAKEGEEINIEESKLGDLAFFCENDKITHVGIILGNNKIIHASGKVRIDNIDSQGIYCVELARYTHKLKKINRII